jgi:hypothetical protein
VEDYGKWSKCAERSGTQIAFITKTIISEVNRIILLKDPLVPGLAGDAGLAAFILVLE